MPNDYTRMKPLVSAPSRRSRVFSADSSVFLWTLSGLVIASCGGGGGTSLAPGFNVETAIGGIGGNGGGSGIGADTSSSLAGAVEIYVSGIEGTSEPIGMTAENGVARVGNEHANSQLVARVSGEDYSPLPDDTGADGRVFISALTDLVAKALEGDSPPTAQEVLNGIFGTIVSGSGSTLSAASIVSVADIRDMSNYGGASTDLAGRLISRASEAVEALRENSARSTHEGAYSDYVDIQGIRIWRVDGTEIATLELRHHASANDVVSEVADGAHQLDIALLNTLNRSQIINRINTNTDDFSDYAAEYIGDPTTQSITDVITLTSNSTGAIAAAASTEEITKLTYLLEYARAQNTDATAEDSARMNYGTLRAEVRSELGIEIESVVEESVEESSLAMAEGAEEDDPHVFEVSGAFEYGQISNAGDPGDYPPTITVSAIEIEFSTANQLGSDGLLDNFVPETEFVNSDGETETNREGFYGVFSFTSNDQIGEVTWTYTLGGTELRNGFIEALSAGETITERVWVIVHTGGFPPDAPAENQREIVVTITGVNDAPTLNEEHEDWVAVMDGITYNTDSRDHAGANTFSIGDAFDDMDVKDELSFSYSIAYTDDENTLETTDGVVSWLTLDAMTGEFTIDHANAVIGGYTIEVTADDGSGAEDSSVSAEFELDIVSGIVLSQGGTHYLSQYLSGGRLPYEFTSFTAGSGAPSGVLVHADGRVTLTTTVDITEDGGEPLMLPLSVTAKDGTVYTPSVEITVSDEGPGLTPNIDTTNSMLGARVLAPTLAEFSNPTDMAILARVPAGTDNPTATSDHAMGRIMIEAQHEGTLGNSIRFEINTQGLISATNQAVRFGTETVHQNGDIVFTMTVGPSTTLNQIITAINGHNGIGSEPSAGDLVEASLVEYMGDDELEGTEDWRFEDQSGNEFFEDGTRTVLELAGGENTVSDSGIIEVNNNNEEDEIFVVVSNPDRQDFGGEDSSLPLSTVLAYPTVASADGGSARTKYGVISFTIDDDNDLITWTYSLSAADDLLDPHPDVTALAAGDTLTDTFRINLMDEHGGFNERTNRDFSVTITGVDDIAEVVAHRGGSATAPEVEVPEGSYYELTTADINYDDPDIDENGETRDVSYVVSSVTGGTLRRHTEDSRSDINNWDELEADMSSGVFKQSEIDAGNIRFYHDATANTSVVNFEYSVLIGDDYVDDDTSVAIADKAFHLGVDLAEPILNTNVEFAFVDGLTQEGFIFAYSKNPDESTIVRDHTEARIYTDTGRQTQDYEISVVSNGAVNLLAPWNDPNTDSFLGILEAWDPVTTADYLRDGVYLRLRDPDDINGEFTFVDGIDNAPSAGFRTADTYVSKGGLEDTEAFGVMLFNENANDLSSLVLRVGQNSVISTQQGATLEAKAQAYFEEVSYTAVVNSGPEYLLTSGNDEQDYLGSHGIFSLSRQGGVLLWEYEFTDEDNADLTGDTTDSLFIQVVRNYDTTERLVSDEIVEIAVTIDVM